MVNSKDRAGPVSKVWDTVNGERYFREVERCEFLIIGGGLEKGEGMEGQAIGYYYSRSHPDLNDSSSHRLNSDPDILEFIIT
jgi:hypothetical protein